MARGELICHAFRHKLKNSAQCLAEPERLNMTFPKYPEYKDSGVEWLGEVPAHWKCPKLKHLARIRNGRDYKEVEAETGGYPVIGSGGEFARANNYLYQGESVLLGRKGTIDKPLYLNGSFWTVDTMFYTELRPRISGRFLYYYATCFRFDQYSTNTALPSMAQEDLANIQLAVPELREQSTIAAFLDHETARIDALIEEQKRLIELLKEKRQAGISHSVTKGLDPNVPMKDSGVEWLGEVPAHWNQVRLKHVVRQIIDTEHKTVPFHEDGKYLVVRTSNVRDGKLVLEGARYTDADGHKKWTGRGRPKPGDVLFTREAPAGEACLVPRGVDLCLGQRMVLFLVDKARITPDFLIHSIYAGLSSEFIESVSQGSTVVHFNMSDIRNIPMFEPPLEEQNAICSYLRRRLAEFDGLVKEAGRSVELMNERRSALISAAVTGKIDVRNWQSSAEAEAEAYAMAAEPKAAYEGDSS